MGLLGSNQTATPLLHSLQVTQSLNGICIPIVYGQNRVPQLLLWYSDFQSAQPYQQGGKGLGKAGNQYEYFAAILGALAQGTIFGIGNIWSQNGRLALQSVSEQYTVPSGGGTYTVLNAAKYAQDAGVGSVAPFSVTATNYGAPGPATISGTMSTPQRSVPGTPGSGQYSVSSGGIYTFPAASAGQLMEISYSFSLYTLAETEDDTIPLTGPYEITVQFQTQFLDDLGVFFIATGLPLTNVAGAPSPGTYDPNGGNYLFNAADAGLAVAINYEWQQSNSNVDPASTLQFTLISGTRGQAPWTYLTSKHASQAFGYSTIALMGTPKMDLGEAAQLPNYNMELIASLQFGAGIVDADVAACILDILTNPFYGANFEGSIDASLATVAAEYWNSNNFFISPVLNAARSCADIISEWCEAGNVGIYWSEGALKFIPYGDTTTVDNGYVYTPQTHPVVDLNDDDFITDSNEDPVQIERSPWQDAYNQVKVQFSNRQNSYNPDVVTEQDDYATSLYGLNAEGQKDYSFLCTAISATFAANIRLKRLVYIRKKYTFRISYLRYCFLEPMDLVTVTDAQLGLNKEPVRIVSIEEDDDRIATITAEEFPWGTQTATIYPKQPGQPPPPPPSLTSPGDTNVVSVFCPSARVATALANSPNQLWMALNGGPNWGGCQVWMSKDGTSYQPLLNSNTQNGNQNGPTRCGKITADLPAGSDPDTVNTLSVAVSGQLFNVTLAQANALATLSMVGSEYIAYENVTLTGSSNNGTVNDYDLNYLRRGCFSSPDITHPAASPTESLFVRLDSQVFMYSYDPSLAGTTVFLKFTSFNLLQNQAQDIADVTAIPFTFPGVNSALNMTVDSILNGGGTDCTVRIYNTATGVGTDGSFTEVNGAVIDLPAVSETPEACSTTYYVNYDPVGMTYHLYTDQNAWLTDQTASGYIGIGQVLTVAASGGGTTYLPGLYIDNSDTGNAADNPSGPTTTGSGPCTITAYSNNPHTVPAFAGGGIQYYGFLNGVPSVTTLRIIGNYTITGDTNDAAIVVSFDGGSTFTPIFGATSPVPFNNTLPVPPGTNLSNIIIAATVTSASSTAYSTSVLEIDSIIVS